MNVPKKIRLLGRGGMGEVWLAELEDGGSGVVREVALKLFDASIGPDAETLFVNETLALLRLDHPNIVRYLASGLDGPRPWLAMEYVAGTSLRARLRRSRFTVADALALVEQVGQALCHAHEQGVIHADITPGNVMLVTSTRHGGRVKLVDFGLARAIGDGPNPLASSPHSLLSAESPLAGGTPPYAAPEQMRGSAPSVAADVHGLAAVAFRVLYGVVRPRDGSWERVISSWVESHPDEDPRRAACGPVLLRALATDPEERTQTIAEFLAEFRAALSADRAPDTVPCVLCDESAVPAGGRCPSCGAQSPESVCPRCGSHHSGLADACRRCGESLWRPPECVDQSHPNRREKQGILACLRVRGRASEVRWSEAVERLEARRVGMIGNLEIVEFPSGGSSPGPQELLAELFRVISGRGTGEDGATICVELCEFTGQLIPTGTSTVLSGDDVDLLLRTALQPSEAGLWVGPRLQRSQAPATPGLDRYTLWTPKRIAAPTPTVSRHQRAKLRGRQVAEQSALEVLERTAELGAHLILVEGTNGSGRTSMLQRIGELAQEGSGIQCLYTRCTNALAAGAWTAMRPALHQLQAAAEKLPGWSRLDPEANATLSAMRGQSERPSYLTEEPAHARQEMARAIGQLIAAVDGPVVWLIDDLDLAVSDLVELLRELAPRIRHLPLCLVASTRERSDLGLQTAWDAERVLQIGLPPLRAKHVREWLEDAVPTLCGPTLLEHVHQVSRGIPAAVEALVRRINQRSSDGPLNLDMLLEEMNRDDLRAEILACEPIARAVLEALVCCTDRALHGCELDELSAVAGFTPDVSVLLSLSSSGLIREAHDGDVTRWQVSHAEVLEAVRPSLPDATAIAMHGRGARFWLDGSGAGRDGAQVRAAHHITRLGRPRDAAERLIESAEEALAALAPAAALARLEAAIDVASHDASAVQIERHARLLFCEQAIRLGHLDRATEHLSALAAAKLPGSIYRRALLHARLLEQQQDHARALTILEAALQGEAGPDDLDYEVMLAARRAMILWSVDWRRAGEAAASALAAAPSDLHSPLVREAVARLYLVLAQFTRDVGDFDGARRHIGRAAETFGHEEGSVGQAHLDLALANVWWVEAGEPGPGGATHDPQTRRAVERAIEFWRNAAQALARVHVPASRALALSNEGEGLAAIGEYGAARRAFERSLVLHDEIGKRDTRDYVAARLDESERARKALMSKTDQVRGRWTDARVVAQPAPDLSATLPPRE